MSESNFNLTCKVCGNAQNNEKYTAREMMYGLREEFDYFQCANCQCLQIVSFPDDMSAYYPGDYYSFDQYDGKKFRGFKGAIKKKQYELSAVGGGFNKMLRALMGKKEYRILEGYGITKNSRILDVGCGNGRNFLFPLAEVGFSNLLGCDPYLASSITYPNGLEIKDQNIFAMNGAWDIITYHHAFEHLPDPLENLQKIHELLADDGVCILRIPTVSSYAWEHYKTNWVQLDAPRHFFLHSEESMRILAKKANMELVKVMYDSTHFQFTGSEKYIKDQPLSTPKERGVKASLQRKRNNAKYGRQAKQLNREGKGDQAAFFLRKK